MTQAFGVWRPGLMLAVGTVVGLIVGALVTGGVITVVSLFMDDSRSRLTLADAGVPDIPAFAAAPAPDRDACGTRFGCVEGIEGDGVSAYRYLTLDHARQAVIYDEADIYRSDRIVLVFDPDFPSDERFMIRQRLEDVWTRSDA